MLANLLDNRWAHHNPKDCNRHSSYLGTLLQCRNFCRVLNLQIFQIFHELNSNRKAVKSRRFRYGYLFSFTNSIPTLMHFLNRALKHSPFGHSPRTRVFPV